MLISHFASFIRIVDAGSLSRAAEQLGVTQPGLSQQLAVLEADFGAQLLLRHRQGVTATPAGKVVYRHAQTIVRQMEQARTAVAGSTGEVAGNVSIGMLRSLASKLAVPLLAAIRSRFPKVHVRLVETSGEQLTVLLASGTLDIAVMPDVMVTDRFVPRPLVTEGLFLIQQSGGDGEPIALEDITPLPLTLPTRTHPLRLHIERIFAERDLTPNVVVECDTLHETLSTVGHGDIGTILPLGSIDRFPGVLSARAISEPELAWDSSLCMLEDLPLSRAASAVFDLVTESVDQGVATGQWAGLSLRED